MMTRTICLAMMLLAAAAGAAQAGESRKAKLAVAAPQARQQALQVPQPEVLLIMIRSALIGLDHANRTGNYSVLREIGGPALQQHSSGQLSNAFANLRTNNVDLLPAAIATPQLTRPPAVSAQGVLDLVGYFPTQPRRIDFRIVYQAAGGQWRLAGLNVGVAPAAQAEAAPKVRPATGSKAAGMPAAASAKRKP